MLKIGELYRLRNRRDIVVRVTEITEDTITTERATGGWIPIINTQRDFAIRYERLPQSESGPYSQNDPAT